LAIAIVLVVDEQLELAFPCYGTDLWLLHALLHPSSGRTTLSIVPSLDYIHVTYGEPHGQRARQMLTAHPELRELAGPSPSTALWVLLLVVAQLGLAVLVGDRSW